MSDYSAGATSRWGLTHWQWGVVANAGGLLAIIAMLDWEIASVVLSVLGALGYCVGFWMFLGTLDGDRR